MRTTLHLAFQAKIAERLQIPLTRRSGKRSDVTSSPSGPRCGKCSIPNTFSEAPCLKIRRPSEAFMRIFAGQAFRAPGMNLSDWLGGQLMRMHYLVREI